MEFATELALFHSAGELCGCANARVAEASRRYCPGPLFAKSSNSQNSSVVIAFTKDCSFADDVDTYSRLRS